MNGWAGLSKQGCKTLAKLLLAAVIMAANGCEDDGGGGLGSDVGDNDPGVVVALGDSITAPWRGNMPWPVLTGIDTGKAVVNAGVGGDRANDGSRRVGGLLRSHRPGYLLIFLGSNDAIHGADPNAFKETLRSVIAAARANGTIPVIATVPPMVDGHSLFQGGVLAINAAIRALASEEGVKRVDLERAFGSTPEQYLSADGLHPNQDGQDLIARQFSRLF